MTEYRYNHLPLPARHIRVLTIHPGPTSAPMHIELQEQPINIDDEQRVPYEALSYTWGSGDNPVSVRFGPDGNPRRSITRNLSEALPFLRFPDRPRTIWIDAICIDQGNDAEKSIQVAMMGDIFRRASHVVAWLGLATETTFRAFEILQDVGTQVEVDSWHAPILRPSAAACDTTMGDSSVPLPYTSHDAQCIMEVFDRPWFERLWVRQEVNLATRAAVQIGVYSTPWTNVKTTLVCLVYKMCATRIRGAFSSLNMDPLRLAFKMCILGGLYCFSNLPVLLQGGCCKDPRDKLYAVLALFVEREVVDIIPDYSLSAIQVYQDAALKYMNKFRNLNLLESCVHVASSGISQVPGLCSWVPDWSRELSYSLPIIHSSVGIMFRSRFRYLGDGVLRVTGLESAVVQAVEGGDTTSISGMVSLVRRLFTRISPSRDMTEPYATGGSMIDALCSTLARNDFADSYRPHFICKLRFEDTKARLVTLLAAEMLCSHDDLDLDTDDNLIRIKETLRGWRLFTTTNGSIGAAMEGTRDGDRIMLFPGGKTPMVLRPTQGDRFQVIGPCYLHGVMHGEPFLGGLPLGVRQVGYNRVDGLEVGYLDLLTEEIMNVDPRFKTRGIDVLAYEPEYYESGGVRIDAQALEDLGVNLTDFDLI